MSACPVDSISSPALPAALRLNQLGEQKQQLLFKRNGRALNQEVCLLSSENLSPLR